MTGRQKHKGNNGRVRKIKCGTVNSRRSKASSTTGRYPTYIKLKSIEAEQDKRASYMPYTFSQWVTLFV